MIYDTLDLTYYMFIQPSHYTPDLPPTDNTNDELCDSALHNIMSVGSTLQEAALTCNIRKIKVLRIVFSNLFQKNFVVFVGLTDIFEIRYSRSCLLHVYTTICYILFAKCMIIYECTCVYMCVYYMYVCVHAHVLEQDCHLTNLPSNLFQRNFVLCVNQSTVI